MLENNTINIYTDGACLGNPGPGGWAYLYYLNDKKVFSSGGEKNTTNNRMELTAAIKSLQNISFFQLFHFGRASCFFFSAFYCRLRLLPDLLTKKLILKTKNKLNCT